MSIASRVGRKPKRAENQNATLTLRLPAQIKNLIIDQADSCDLSLSEYVTTLVMSTVHETPDQA